MGSTEASTEDFRRSAHVAIFRSCMCKMVGPASLFEATCMSDETTGLPVCGDDVASAVDECVEA